MADVEHSAWVLTGMGADHPGILDDVTSHVLSQGGRLGGLHVGRLRGQTVVLLELRADEDSVQRLRDGLASLAERTGLTLDLQESPDVPAQGRPLKLVASGEDVGGTHPGGDGGGTLNAISNLCRVLSINIADVQIELEKHTWRLTLALDAPRELPEDKLRELLAQLMQERGARWDLVTV